MTMGSLPVLMIKFKRQAEYLDPDGGAGMDDGVTPADRDVLEKLRQFGAAMPAALQAED